MQLRMIDCEADEYLEFRQLNFPFQWSTHHVKEIFLACLPKGYSLDGSSKITLTCGPRPDDEPVYEQVLGTSQLYVEDFDFTSYKQATAEQRQETILELIVRSFRDIASRHAAGTQELEVAAEEVRNAHFRKEILVKKLSRWTPDRKRQLKVMRKLSLELGEAWSVDIVDKKGEVVDVLWITERPSYLDRTDLFHKSRWVDNVFEILDSFGKSTIQVDPHARTVTRYGEVLFQKRMGRRYDLVPIDVQQLVERAAASAGHAYKSGDFESVIALLEPYADHLSAKQLARLEAARANFKR